MHTLGSDSRHGGTKGGGRPSAPLGRWRAWLRLVLGIALLVGMAVPSHAGSNPLQKCAGGKVKAAGRGVYAKTTCYQKAFALGGMVDGACLATAQQNFLDAFAKAEAAAGRYLGGCVVIGDASMIEAAVDTCVTTFTDAITGNAKCGAAKMKAVGKKSYGKAKCHQKAILKGAGVDSLCLSKAETKFTAATAKADGLGTCSGTAAVLDPLVDTCVGNLWPRSL